ncbi:MAG TPA: hypothetical protein PLV68_15585 [Ilumatobacteraceae bacterium]|nr:hypothetical protein [Ilumatobacteraceae bacterium]
MPGNILFGLLGAAVHGVVSMIKAERRERRRRDEEIMRVEDDYRSGRLRLRSSRTARQPASRPRPAETATERPVGRATISGDGVVIRSSVSEPTATSPAPDPPAGPR